MRPVCPNLFFESDLNIICRTIFWGRGLKCYAVHKSSMQWTIPNKGNYIIMKKKFLVEGRLQFMNQECNQPKAWCLMFTLFGSGKWEGKEIETTGVSFLLFFKIIKDIKKWCQMSMNPLQTHKLRQNKTKRSLKVKQSYRKMSEVKNRKVIWTSHPENKERWISNRKCMECPCLQGLYLLPFFFC